jgi:Integrase core domain
LPPRYANGPTARFLTHEQLNQHLNDFINAYNFSRRLKTLKGLTPYEFICKCWTEEPKDSK